MTYDPHYLAEFLDAVCCNYSTIRASLVPALIQAHLGAPGFPTGKVGDEVFTVLVTRHKFTPEYREHSMQVIEIKKRFYGVTRIFIYILQWWEVAPGLYCWSVSSPDGTLLCFGGNTTPYDSYPTLTAAQGAGIHALRQYDRNLGWSHEYNKNIGRSSERGSR